MSLVWDNFPRGGSDKLAMLALADWCNDQGGSLHPSMSTIAKKINLTEKQARVIVHRLIEECWVAVVGNVYGGNPGQSRQYQVNIQMLLTPPVEVTPNAKVTPPPDVTPPVQVTPPVEVRDPSRGGSFTPPAHGSLTTSEPSITTNKSKSAPATRLPEDWMPSAADVSFCKTERPDLDPVAVADGFRDYWIAVPGAKGKKSNWPATWRNWIRNQRQGQARASPYESEKDRSRREFAESIFGKTKHEPANERDITGIAERVD